MQACLWSVRFLNPLKLSQKLIVMTSQVLVCSVFCEFTCLCLLFIVVILCLSHVHCVYIVLCACEVKCEADSNAAIFISLCKCYSHNFLSPVGSVIASVMLRL